MSKKPRKPRQLPNDGLDKGTPEYQAKVTLVKVETDQKSFAYRVKDQRPIDKYHRWYVEDEAKGISDSGCRGLNHDQFRVADRMFSLDARTVLLPAQGSLLQVRVDTSTTPAAFQIERCMQAIHDYQHIAQQLNTGSLEIVEAICCQGYTLGDVETSKAWRKGYAIVRLREALDELAGVWRRRKK